MVEVNLESGNSCLSNPRSGDVGLTSDGASASAVEVYPGSAESPTGSTPFDSTFTEESNGSRIFKHGEESDLNRDTTAPRELNLLKTSESLQQKAFQAHENATPYDNRSSHDKEPPLLLGIPCESGVDAKCSESYSPKVSRTASSVGSSEGVDRTDGGSSGSTLWGKTKEEYIMMKEVLPEGLDLYDVVSKPRRLSDPGILEQTSSLTLSDLRTDLSCPICMGVLQHTVVVKSCLHRFCAECIEKCVRIGIRECPQCRIHVASRRSLRADPVFDQIINRLFPDVEAFEEKNQSLLAEVNKRFAIRHDDPPGVNKSYNMENEVLGGRAVSGRASPISAPLSSPSNNLRSGVYVGSDGAAQQRDCCSGISFSSHFRDSDSIGVSTVADGRLKRAEKRRRKREIEAQIRKIPTDGKLHFELVADPSLPDLPSLPGNNRISTDGHLTVLQLTRYLSYLIELNDDQVLKLYTKEHRQPFLPNSTLAHVHHQSFSLSHEVVVLYYTTVSGGPSSSASSFQLQGDFIGGTLKGVRGYVAPPLNAQQVTHSNSSSSQILTEAGGDNSRASSVHACFP